MDSYKRMREGKHVGKQAPQGMSLRGIAGMQLNHRGLSKTSLVARNESHISAFTSHLISERIEVVRVQRF